VLAPSFVTIDADALTVLAGDRIDLANVTLVTHNGYDVATLAGDSAMLDAYAAYGGNVPGSGYANAVFIAPNEVRLGNYDFYGDYLYLKSDLVTLNNTIDTWLPGSEGSPIVNPDVIIQMQPYSSGLAVGVEDQMPTSPMPGTTYYTNADHFSRFPGTSLFVGGAGYDGAVAIGQDGMIDIGGQNFLVASTAPITGAGNILTTGLSNVAGSLAPPPPPPPPPAPTPTTEPLPPVNTGVVNTFVQQTTSTTPTETSATSVPQETVEANVPPEEQVEASTSSEEDSEVEPMPDAPVDMIAALESQPLVDGQVEVNGAVLTCQ